MNKERLHELLTYNPDTGFFKWKPGRRGGKKDMPAGTVDKTSGYVYITVDGIKYAAHRLAFVYMTGDWPHHTVDHWDNIRGNNAWHNIRDATYGQNLANRGKMKSNTSGFIGVTSERGKWKAVCRGKFLGRFDSPEEASMVYQKEAAQQYGDFLYAGGYSN